MRKIVNLSLLIHVADLNVLRAICVFNSLNQIDLQHIFSQKTVALCQKNYLICASRIWPRRTLNESPRDDCTIRINILIYSIYFKMHILKLEPFKVSYENQSYKKLKSNGSVLVFQNIVLSANPGALDNTSTQWFRLLSYLGFKKIVKPRTGSYYGLKCVNVFFCNKDDRGN